MKIIVAHPGRQHSFRVAKALKECGLLYKYATTVYNKDSSLLMRFVKLFLMKDNYKRAQRRKCPSLTDDDVIQFCELEGLLLLALIRLDFTHKLSNAYNEYISRKFQRKLAEYIIQNKIEAVISYDTNSMTLFSILKEKAPNVIRIMDNAAPNRHYMHKDFHAHWDSCGPFSKTFEVYGYLTDEKKAMYYGEEVKMANYHIVASDYSKKALEYEGVSSETIFKIPYGVDQSFIFQNKRIYSNNRLNVLFVGQINQLKGIYQILEAAKEINNPNVTFNIVGSGKEAFKDILYKYESYVRFHGFLYKEKLHEQYESNHIFVFPTMGEGFGLVLLEAMAAGLPVITTRNCGGSDIIQNGENGFFIEVGDTKALVDKIMWCLGHPKEVEAMSLKATETAKQYTWERYEENIVKTVLKIKEFNNK
jgi:glycosyltransferase involved in cell wall biosynthesis